MTSPVVQIPIAVMGPRGVNAFLLAGPRPVIVDTGIPGSAPQILEVLARLGHAPSDVALIVITHAHIDHAGDAGEIKQATGAPVVAHRLDAPAISAGVSEPVRGRTPEARMMLDRLGAAATPPFVGLATDILVDDEYSLEALGLDGSLIHTPGHTDGGLTLVTSTGEAIVGDIVGSDGDDPDVAALGLFATDEDVMIDSVKKVLSFDPIGVFCGHGGPFDRRSLAPLRATLDQDAR